MPRRLGILGGTFDPPHVGHLALAECAREQLGLERVLFVPAGDPPHKRGGVRVSPAARRLAMTRAAVQGNPAFVVSAIETRRRGPSWTVDTVRALALEHAGAELWLLMGADSFAAFGSWREPAEIVRHVRLAVAVRPGTRRPAPPAGVPRARVTWLANPALEVSSSAVRERARAGLSMRYLVPDAVARYAVRHGLYRSAS
ncbi:MAG: nicotinate-nucleotide adenylyltransferase [Candidatus Eisenbacteria bacterium]